MELANKFFQSVVVQIRDPRNMVVLRRLSGSQKATMLIVQPACFLSALSSTHSFNLSPSRWHCACCIDLRNRIQVLGRASDGSVARHTITVHYQPGKERSLALEVFLENENALLI